MAPGEQLTSDEQVPSGGRPIRIGIVGAGGMGRTHVDHYADVGGADIVAVCDPVAAAAEALADRAGERTGQRPQVYGDLAALLAGGESGGAPVVDAISICTPPVDHVGSIGMAMERGVAVLCEKPPTRTGDELAALQQAADRLEHPPVVQFGMCHPFHPPVQQARELITSGRLGEVVHLNIRFAFRFEGLADRWFSDPEVAGGGVILDTLVHSISISRALVGDPRTVSAFVHTVDGAVRVEDSAVLVLQGESGAVSVLQASWATPSGGAGIQVHGSGGEARIDYAEPTLRHRLGTATEWQIGDPAAEDRFHGQARSFLAAVRSGTVTDNTLSDARAVMQVIDAAYASADRDGAAVALV